jgi:uncharacterized protein YfaS (alpha-2-macroglobulin family)
MKKLLTIVASGFLLWGCDIPLEFMPDILADTNDVEIVFVSSTPKIENVQGKTPVTFLWDKPIFKLQNPEVTQRALHKYIKITPEIEGAWQLLGTTGVLFEPKKEWQGATRYSFSFPTGTVPDKYEYWFETPQMVMTKLDAESLIKQNPLIVSFSEEISLEEAQKMFVTPEMKFRFQYHEREETNKKGKKEIITDKKMIEFHPQSDWVHDTKYTITLPQETNSLRGNLLTKEAQTKEFRTLGPLKVKKMNIPQNVYDGLSVEFSTPVGVDDFFGSLTAVQPNAIAGQVYLENLAKNYYQHKNGSKRFFLSPPVGGWQAETQYEFLINENLQDIHGQSLSQENKITFTTKFPNQISPTYFPHGWKAYRHGVTPKFSVWHTGDVRDIRLSIHRIFPEEKTIEHKFEWESDPQQRTIKELDLTKLASEFIDETGNIAAGIYEIELSHTNPENARWRPKLLMRFAITDFSVELNIQKTGKSIAKTLPFPGENISFAGIKNVTLLSQNERMNKWQSFREFETSKNPFPILGSNIFVIIENEGKIGIGSDFFNNGINPYDAFVNYDPYFYNYTVFANTIFTDRPLFKPGDRVYFKSFYRLFDFEGKNSVLQTMRKDTKTQGNITITSPRWQEVHNEKTTFDNGSMNGYWDIPKDATLGRYRINLNYSPKTSEDGTDILKNKEQNSFFDFYVTEYRKPDFLIDASFDTETALWKEKINANVLAEYAFGGGLAGKKVDYTISLFGYKKTRWFWERESERDKLLVHGQDKLDQSGNLNIPIDLDFEWDEGIDWGLVNLSVTVHTSAMDASSQTISIPFSRADRKISLENNRSFFQRSETEEVTISGTVTDISKKEIKGQKLTAILGKTKWVRNDRKGGNGEFIGEWRRDVETIDTKTFSSQENGRFTEKIPLPQEGGEYEITVSAIDKKGRTEAVSQSFWVWSSANSQYSIRGNDVNKILPLYRDKNEYSIGENVEILFPFNEWKLTRAHATIERGEIIEEVSVDMEKQMISFSAEKWMAPNIFVSLLIEGINEDGEPEIRWGTVEINVKNPENKLEITLTPEKEQYKPQETVKLKVQTNVLGKGKTSEVTIAVVDRTLLALKSRPALNLWQNFFSNVPLGVYTTHTLANFVSEKDLNDIYEKIKKIKVMGSDSFGGGGGASKGETFKARGDFRDTATFLASVQTDENGFAEVEIPLPDNLTTWNIWAVGTTLDNSFGEAETEIKTTLPLLISPIAPNFFRAGDTTQIGLLVKNNTKQKDTIQITLNLPEELKAEKRERKISVTDEERVYFDITVPYDKTDIPLDGIEKEFTITIEAESGTKDAVKLTRKILPPIMQVNAAEFLTVKEPTTITVKTDERSLRSVLKLNVFRTLLNRVKTFVNIADRNNYHCLEQEFTYWTTRILERDIQKQTGQKELSVSKQSLEKIIKDLIRTQRGGFKFWEKSYEPSVWLTAHILDFAPIWAENGSSLPNENYRMAWEWLRGEVFNKCNQNSRQHCMAEATRQYAAYVLMREGKMDATDLDFLTKYIKQTEAKAWFLRSALFFPEKKLSSIVRTKRDELTEELKQLLQARDRYVFWTEPERNFYSQDERLTAIVLEYLMQKEELESYQPKIVRFLAEAKNISGNTALFTLRALKEYAEKNETSAEKEVAFSVIEKNKNAFTFSGIFDAPQSEAKTLNEKIETNESFQIEFKSKNNEAYYSDIELEEVFAAKDLTPVAKGFWIEREFYDIDDIYFENPLKEMQSGKHYRVRVRVVTNTNHRQVLVEDAVLTGAEGVDFLLDNVDTTIQEKTKEEEKYGRWWRPFVTHQEFYHDKVRFFVPDMNAGVHDFQYVVRARIPGEYEQLPSSVKEMYYPEVFATGEGAKIEIKK